MPLGLGRDLDNLQQHWAQDGDMASTPMHMTSPVMPATLRLPHAFWMRSGAPCWSRVCEGEGERAKDTKGARSPGSVRRRDGNGSGIGAQAAH